MRRTEPTKDERRVRELVDPKRPSPKEVEEHERNGHLPYRIWCTVCVRRT